MYVPADKTMSLFGNPIFLGNSSERPLSKNKKASEHASEANISKTFFKALVDLEADLLGDQSAKLLFLH